MERTKSGLILARESDLAGEGLIRKIAEEGGVRQERVSVPPQVASYLINAGQRLALENLLPAIERCRAAFKAPPGKKGKKPNPEARLAAMAHGIGELHKLERSIRELVEKLPTLPAHVAPPRPQAEPEERTLPDGGDGDDGGTG